MPDKIGEILERFGYWYSNADSKSDIAKARLALLNEIEKMVVPKKRKLINLTDALDKETFRREGFNKCRQEVIANFERLKG